MDLFLNSITYNKNWYYPNHSLTQHEIKMIHTLFNPDNKKSIGKIINKNINKINNNLKNILLFLRETCLIIRDDKYNPEKKIEMIYNFAKDNNINLEKKVICKLLNNINLLKKKEFTKGNMCQKGGKSRKYSKGKISSALTSGINEYGTQKNKMSDRLNTLNDRIDSLVQSYKRPNIDYSQVPLWELFIFFLYYLENTIPLMTYPLDAVQSSFAMADAFSSTVSPYIQKIIMFISNILGLIPIVSDIAEPIAAIAETITIAIPIFINYLVILSEVALNLSRKDWIIFYKACWDLVPNSADVRLSVISNARMVNNWLEQLNKILILNIKILNRFIDEIPNFYELKEKLNEFASKNPNRLSNTDIAKKLNEYSQYGIKGMQKIKETNLGNYIVNKTQGKFEKSKVLYNIYQAKLKEIINKTDSARLLNLYNNMKNRSDKFYTLMTSIIKKPLNIYSCILSNIFSIDGGNGGNIDNICDISKQLNFIVDQFDTLFEKYNSHPLSEEINRTTSDIIVTYQESLHILDMLFMVACRVYKKIKEIMEEMKNMGMDPATIVPLIVQYIEYIIHEYAFDFVKYVGSFPGLNMQSLDKIKIDSEQLLENAQKTSDDTLIVADDIRSILAYKEKLLEDKLPTSVSKSMEKEHTFLTSPEYEKKHYLNNQDSGKKVQSAGIKKIKKSIKKFKYLNRNSKKFKKLR